MELYYGISGMGAVCNTINPRLLPDDIAYIVDHAEDGVIFCDPQFLPIISAVAPKVEALRAVVVLDHAAPPADLPVRVALYAYEDLMAEMARHPGMASVRREHALRGSAIPPAPQGGPRACFIPIAPRYCTPW